MHTSVSLRYLAVVILLAAVVLASVVVYRINKNAVTLAACSTTSSSSTVFTVDATACPARTVCQTGVVRDLGDGGLQECAYLDDPVGTACDSQCYATGTATQCDSHHECSSTNQSACLGHCEITAPDWAILQSNHPDCVGKLTFKPYFVWNTPGASDIATNHLYYSNLEPDCYAEHGCRWYGLALRAYWSQQTNGTLGNWFAPTGAIYSCVDFLNVSNPECIEGHAMEMGANQSNAFLREKLEPFTGLNISRMQFYATICNYWYRCEPNNQTYYSDPQYIWDGNKRSVDDAPAKPTMLPNERALQVALMHIEKHAEVIANGVEETFRGK